MDIGYKSNFSRSEGSGRFGKNPHFFFEGFPYIILVIGSLTFTFNLSGQFTLFVPTDLAFNQFLQKLGGIKEVKLFLITQF